MVKKSPHPERKVLTVEATKERKAVLFYS